MALTIEPVQHRHPRGRLDDLHERLARTRFSQQLPTRAGTTAPSSATSPSSSRTGATSTTGDAPRRALNAFDHFLTEIDGTRVHFLHARSPEPDAFPLIVTHGWPGSIVEFLDIIGPLSDPRAHGGDPADAFHVVCPSIPGYAFSGPDAPSGAGTRGGSPRRGPSSWPASATSATARRAATGAR